ncbi:hypothetical protein WJX74_004354 [Apatococcus lobatus]|uniref:dolichyl-phosphate beta-glucosyltransferase n=1 Tax=Apatococcus lobatus TaxID=904363 RepID=A0AAW1SG34_9CHLO
MAAPLATAFAAAGVITLFSAWRWLTVWFKKLDQDCEFRTSVLGLETPFSVQKVAAPSILSDPAKLISFVIPAYNEALRLPATLDETLGYLQRRRDRQGPGFTYEIIIVDDGSSDDTARVAGEYVKQAGLDAVRLLRLPANRGKGYAVRTGMMICRGQLILMMDADGATRVSDVEKLEAALETVAVKGAGEVPQQARQAPSRIVVRNEGLGMAVGSRSHLENEALAKRSWYRNFLMRGFHLLVLSVAGGAIRDTQCGFKLLTRRTACTLAGNQRLQRWCFDVELIYVAQKLGIPIAEVPVNWTEIPGSKIKVTSIIHMAWELAAILIGYSWLGLWRIHLEAGS